MGGARPVRFKPRAELKREVHRRLPLLPESALFIFPSILVSLLRAEPVIVNGVVSSRLPTAQLIYKEQLSDNGL